MRARFTRLFYISAGEVAAQDICVECAVGTYSFDSGVPCQSCPEGAACYGRVRLKARLASAVQQTVPVGWGWICPITQECCISLTELHRML